MFEIETSRQTLVNFQPLGRSMTLRLPVLVAIHWLGGGIIVNLLRKLFRHCVLVTSTGKHILGQCDDNFCTEMKKDDQICMLGKSCSTGPRSSRYPAILGLITSFSSHYFYSSLYSTTSFRSSESHQRPPCCWRRRSAPPWITWVVVRMILAWCHSLFEFKSSPLWLEMNVPSSTSIVKGFLYAFSICISK